MDGGWVGRRRVKEIGEVERTGRGRREESGWGAGGWQGRGSEEGMGGRRGQGKGKQEPSSGAAGGECEAKREGGEREVQTVGERKVQTR